MREKGPVLILQEPESLLRVEARIQQSQPTFQQVRHQPLAYSNDLTLDPEHGKTQGLLVDSTWHWGLDHDCSSVAVGHSLLAVGCVIGSSPSRVLVPGFRSFQTHQAFVLGILGTSAWGDWRWDALRHPSEESEYQAVPWLENIPSNGPCNGNYESGLKKHPAGPLSGNLQWRWPKLNNDKNLLSSSETFMVPGIPGKFAMLKIMNQI